MCANNSIVLVMINEEWGPQEAYNLITGSKMLKVKVQVYKKLFNTSSWAFKLACLSFHK